MWSASWWCLKGWLLTMGVTLALSFPIEKPLGGRSIWKNMRRSNRWTDLIEVSINNLAAVPSIIFGLLGLAIFLQYEAPTALGRLALAAIDAGAHDHAGHRHRRAQRHQGGAALNP